MDHYRGVGGGVCCCRVPEGEDVVERAQAGTLEVDCWLEMKVPDKGDEGQCMERHPMVRPGGVVVLVDCPRDFLTLDVQCISTETQ